jgi:hypothetical protein
MILQRKDTAFFENLYTFFVLNKVLSFIANAYSIFSRKGAKNTQRTQRF